MHGRWFCCAISCARRCFLTVSGKYVPPLTVASLATMMHSTPSTCPMPVTMPALGASPLYISHAASAENSRNAECGSMSSSTRSRAGSLPRATCLAIASAPPPCATSAWRAASSSSNDTKRSRFAANSGDAGSTRDSMTAIVVRLNLRLARDGACTRPTRSVSHMSSVFECVPNVSEGRRADVIAAIGAAAAGPDVVRLAGAAIERIDLRAHSGEHPRMGAVDVIPFIPVSGATMDDAVGLAHQCAAQVWERYRLPSYFYEFAATRPERRDLGNVRKGQFEGLIEAVKDPARHPDTGEPALHPSAGIVAIGARNFLIAFNVNLATGDLALAERIALAVRRRSGGLLGIKALGFALSDSMVQVSMNVVDVNAIPLYRVTELIRREAAAAGVAVANCELVGLAPLSAIAESAAYYLHLESIDPRAVTW